MIKIFFGNLEQLKTNKEDKMITAAENKRTISVIKLWLDKWHDHEC